MYKIFRETMEVKFTDDEEFENFAQGMAQQDWDVLDSTSIDDDEYTILVCFQKIH